MYAETVQQGVVYYPTEGSDRYLQGSSLEIQIGGVSDVRDTLELRAYRLKASFSADMENGKSRLLPEMCIGTCLWIAREAL